MSEVKGTVASGFDRVREAFQAGFDGDKEIGAACSAYWRGDKVMDLWGGVRDRKHDLPWNEDTMVLVFSVTKGLASMAVALAHTLGWLDYESPVARYWPEFAQNGKGEITVHQLLTHQAGLPFLDRPVSLDDLNAPDRLGGLLARQKPQWRPGTEHGYHAYSIGWLESELLRRVDPKRRTLGVFFRDELARPLGLDFHIGLPADIPVERVATMHMPNMLRGFLSPDPRMKAFLGAIIRPWTMTSRTFMASMRRADVNDRRFLATENAAFGGVGTARSIARAYDVFARGGKELKLGKATLEALTGASASPSGGDFDRIIRMPMRYSVGFMKPYGENRFGSGDGAFGAPGAGGAFAFADPDRQVAFAYTANRFGLSLLDDPREKRVRDALYAAIDASA
jgi:CubicO group peptidase (beta-lactamase class C family)